jgi:hypothetical protein
MFFKIQKLVLVMLLILFFPIKMFADQSLLELDRIISKQERALETYELGKRYFPHYWNSDIGKAKAIYLYLYATLLDSERNLKQANVIFAKYNDGSLDKFFSVIVENVVNMKADFNKIEEKLKMKVFPIEPLKQGAPLMDIMTPITEIIYGRLDSDKDGVPDNIELQGKNQNVTCLLTGTVVLTEGYGFNFDSGSKTGFTGSGAREILYWIQGEDEVLQGSYYLNMAGRNSVPESGYSVDKVLKNLVVGSKWAMKYPGNYYVIFEILDHNLSKSITIRY